MTTQHVWCIDATCIAVFPNGEEAIEKYDAIPDEGIEISIGDNKFIAQKSDISVMPLDAFDNL